MPENGLFSKTAGNVEEVRARCGRVLGLVSAHDESAAGFCHLALPMPHAPEDLLPLAIAVPLQLIAYHTALLRGYDVDKPRNLAKSVTVE